METTEKTPEQVITMSVMKEFIYFTATEFNRWGKGYNLKESNKNAKALVRTKRVTWVAIFNEFENDEHRKNIYSCITANSFNGNPEFYKNNRTPEDTEMINKYFIGWAIIENTTTQLK